MQGWLLARSEKAISEEQRFAHIVQQLLRLTSECSFHDALNAVHRFSIELVDESDPDVAAHWKPSTGLRLPYKFVKLASVVTYDDAFVTAEANRYSDAVRLSIGEAEYLIASGACSALDARLFDLCLAANVALPGAFSYRSTLRLVNGAFVESGYAALHQLDEALDASVEYSWPPLGELPLSSVVSWLDNMPGFRDRVGRTRLGRAIGALSYLIKEHSRDENELSIVWALLGIEALYGRGSEAIKNQVIEKCESFLGKPVTHTKNLSRMYDHRSRVIHGDLDIAFRHSNSGTEGISDFFDRLYESERVATAVLLSTLQRMCAEQKHELSFRYLAE
jgi:hypothetical protein